MNDTMKTLVAVGAAAVMAGLVWATRPVPPADARFADQGEVFYPEFTDPTRAHTLEVIGFDEDTATFNAFSVSWDGSRWVIPSHFNYPADAEQKMAEAASAFIGLRKEQLVSDAAADHAALGVVAPDDDAAPMTGRGTRITIKDEHGAVLSDLIIGSQPKVAGEGGPRRYVRVPGKNRVYETGFNPTFSTSFSDWVETDLLKLGGEQVERLFIDRYQVDETKGIKTEGETIELRRTKQTPGQTTAGPTWTLDANPGGPPGEWEELESYKVEEIVSTLRSLRLIGVRPKPQKLADFFAGKTAQLALDQLDQLQLQSRGFFVTPNGRFVANEGELLAATGDGVVYTLYFGEVVVGKGAALSAGTDQASEGSAESASGETEAKGEEGRYVFVTAVFDESLIPPVEKPAELIEAEQAESKPEASNEGAEGTAAPDPAADAKKAALDALRTKYEADVKARDEKVAKGKKRAADLAARFSPWYYVVSAESVAKLRPVRGDLIKVKEPPAGAQGESGAGPQAPLSVPSEPASGGEPSQQTAPETPPGDAADEGEAPSEAEESKQPATNPEQDAPQARAG